MYGSLILDFVSCLYSIPRVTLFRVSVPFHVQGVENVYTRHKPLLVDTLEQLVREKLSETDYPYCGEFRLADKSVHIISIITVEPLNRGHSQ